MDLATRSSPNPVPEWPVSRRNGPAKPARSNSRLRTVPRSMSITQYRQAADKTLQGMLLIEEACLTALLEHLARTGDENGMSTQEISERIGLVHRLGPGVSEAVVSKLLCNLARSDRTEPVPETLATARWRIAEVEAAIRPMPVMDVTAQTSPDGRRNQGHESDQ